MEYFYVFVVLIFLGIVIFRSYQLGKEQSFNKLHDLHVEEISKMQSGINFRDYLIDSITKENKLLNEKLMKYEND